MGDFIVITNTRGRGGFNEVGLKIVMDKAKSRSLLDICFRKPVTDLLGWKVGDRLQISMDHEGERLMIEAADKTLKGGFALQRTAATVYLRLATPKQGFPKEHPPIEINPGDFLVDKDKQSIVINYGSYFKR